MRLEQLLPLPILNIYENCKSLKSVATTYKREQVIKEITLDIFRILIAIPLASISMLNGPRTGRLLISAICYVCLPESMAIALSGTLTILSVALVIHSVATLQIVVLSVGALLFAGAYLCSENYNFLSKEGNSLEDFLLDPISTRIAKAFV